MRLKSELERLTGYGFSLFMLANLDLLLATKKENWQKFIKLIICAPKAEKIELCKFVVNANKLLLLPQLTVGTTYPATYRPMPYHYGSTGKWLPTLPAYLFGSLRMLVT